MIPELVLGAIREGFVMGQKLFEFLASPAGQELVREGLKDKTKFDAAFDAFQKRLASGWDEFWRRLEIGAGK